MRVHGLLDRWDRLSGDEIRWYQIRRLREFLARQVIPFSAHYRELFARERIDVASLKTLDDLRRIPFTDKTLVSASPERPGRTLEFLLRPDAGLIREHWPKTKLLRLAARRILRGRSRVASDLGREYRPASLIFTTGRSSQPVPFALSLYDLEIMRIVGGRILEVIGAHPDADRGVNVFPYAPHLAFWQVAYCGIAGGMLMLNTGGGRVMGTDRILDAITRLKPTFVAGMPGYVYHLLRRAFARGLDLASVTSIALGGDNVTMTTKTRLVELLRELGSKSPRVLSVYGFTESRVCWAECSGHPGTGFHTYPDLGIFEIVDPATGETLPDGETGELVYTPLDGRGTIVLRYRTGDLIQGGITRAPCPVCGRTVPRVSSVIGRASNQKTFNLSKVKGTLVDFNSFSAVLGDDPDIEEWQLVIKKQNDDPLEVDEIWLYVCVNARKDEAAVEKEIRERILRATEVNLNRVVFVTMKEILERLGMETDLKEKRILDLRSQANGASRVSAPVESGDGAREG